jgi:hypothetical protein
MQLVLAGGRCDERLRCKTKFAASRGGNLKHCIVSRPSVNDPLCALPVIGRKSTNGTEDRLDNKCSVGCRRPRRQAIPIHRASILGHGLYPFGPLGLLDAPPSRGMTVFDSVVVAALLDVRPRLSSAHAGPDRIRRHFRRAARTKLVTESGFEPILCDLLWITGLF